MSEDTTKDDGALTATPATADNSGLPIRPLGRTGLNVSAIGFGAAPIGDLYARLDESAAIGAVTAAIDAGITLFDAAPLYGHGLAEHRCGTALRGHPRGGFVLSTKVGRWMDPSNGAGRSVQDMSAACRTPR